MVDRAKETVLIVEDDEGIAYLQRQTLERAGYLVLCADSEAKALAYLAHNDVDLIILDYRLPGERTGLDLYADFKAAGYNQPVVMVTGFRDETTVVKALRAGVRDFVTKSDEYLQYLPLAVERVLVQIRLENRLAESDKQLRQAQKMEAIGTLAGGVAHEFNNLLQAIQGYTRYAIEGLDPEDERRKDLEQVIHASDRAADLTRQLLGFGRREMLQLTDIEPNSLVRDLVKMMRPLIGEHIKLDLSLDEDVGIIHADAGHIQQLLMNLCVNARDAMPEGGQLVIKTENLVLTDAYCEYHPDVKPGRYLVLDVADSGCGMTAEVKDHIFEPFFTTKGVGKGTGLGLAMVYGVAQRHQGTIHVYSELGAGTTFRIYLPTMDHASVAASAAPVQEVASSGSETILIAEDDPLVRQLAVRMLERAGYQTITAADGEEAVRQFERNIDRIPLALLDVVMPRLGGREAFEKMKALNPNVQAIFCSGYDPQMAQVGFVVDDDLRLIQKPFVPELLLATIREILDNQPCTATV
ncbi:MAG: response regulator [Pirellulales bacterium]